MRFPKKLPDNNKASFFNEAALNFSFVELYSNYRISYNQGFSVRELKARSSVVEHHLDMVVVGGSIPLVPTRSVCNPLYLQGIFFETMRIAVCQSLLYRTEVKSTSPIRLP